MSCCVQQISPASRHQIWMHLGITGPFGWFGVTLTADKTPLHNRIPDRSCLNRACVGSPGSSRLIELRPVFGVRPKWVNKPLNGWLRCREFNTPLCLFFNRIVYALNVMHSLLESARTGLVPEPTAWTRLRRFLTLLGNFSWSLEFPCCEMCLCTNLCNLLSWLGAYRCSLAQKENI